MIFRICGKEYCGSSALEIVKAIRREAFAASEFITPRLFMLNSLAEFGRRVPLGEFRSFNRLDDETFALSYLYLRDEHGLGELSDVPNRSLRVRPLHFT